GVRSGYRGIADLLMHPGLEAVVTCLPPASQTDAAIAVLEAGKHLWIEPPPGLTVADCDRVIRAAASSGCVVRMGFHMRWHRLICQARDIVRSGRLGTIQTLRAVWNSP